jgi:hypothetical protein
MFGDGSDQVAAGGLLFLFHHGFCFLLQNYPHGLVEDGLEAVLGQSTAFHVFAFELFFDHLPRCLFHHWCVFGVFLHLQILVAQVDLVAHEYLWHVTDVLLQFGVPLIRRKLTFLRALTKEDGSITENMMRKTSQWG